MLTIGVLFCDNDLDYLKGLIENIKNKVWIDYELIFCDNRNNFDDDISFLDDYKVVNKEQGNIYQLAGRKKIIEEATGSYIWFVDADDDVFPIDESFNDLLENNYDEYVFSYIVKSEEEENWPLCIENKLIENDLLTPECINTPCCLWNKWIKTTVLKEVIKYVPDSIRASASEDLFYTLATLKLSNTQYQSNKYIYTYYCLRSSSAIQDYSNYYDKFERCLFGLNEATELIKSIITDDDLTKLELDLDENDSCFFLKKIITTKNVDTKEKMLKKLQSVLPAETLINAWILLIDSYSMYEEDFTNTDELMYKYFNNSICNVINTEYVYDDGTTETIIESERKVPSMFKTI